jgi:hypothetical protein
MGHYKKGTIRSENAFRVCPGAFHKNGDFKQPGIDGLLTFHELAHMIALVVDSGYTALENINMARFDPLAVRDNAQAYVMFAHDAVRKTIDYDYRKTVNRKCDDARSTGLGRHGKQRAKEKYDLGVALNKNRSCWRKAHGCCGNKKVHGGKLLSQECCASCEFYDALPRCQAFVKNGYHEDTNKNCHGWAMNGSCKNNPGYMLGSCSKSCYLKAKGIKVIVPDRQRNCFGLARAGECKRNPRYMLPNCSTSCNNLEKGINKPHGNDKAIIDKLGV